MIAYPGMTTTGPFNFTAGTMNIAAPAAAPASDAKDAPAKAKADAAPAATKKKTTKKKKGCCA